nr:MAG TPA: hypothetical protein [Caudoviricetes sp.]
MICPATRATRWRGLPPVTPCVPCRLHLHNSFFYRKSKYTNRRNELRTVDLRIKLKGDR